MTTATPTVNGGTITSWSVSPSLPAGLSLDSSTGAISGTPNSGDFLCNLYRDCRQHGW
ncbi:MAG: putative PE-PGRS family protein [uncultured Candidatus Poseidoniales archaeon]|nr:MAG: putative PE-PGRS family protein [uncultured Candidatus Poseidoniales archaeon]